MAMQVDKRQTRFLALLVFSADTRQHHHCLFAYFLQRPQDDFHLKRHRPAFIFSRRNTTPRALSSAHKAGRGRSCSSLLSPLLLSSLLLSSLLLPSSLLPSTASARRWYSRCRVVRLSGKLTRRTHEQTKQ